MKIFELFEGTLRKGYYDYGHYPTSRDKGLGHWHNNVLPALSRTFGIPVVNFKTQSDFGYGFQETKKRSVLYSVERVILRVILRKKGLDIELIKEMLPKALKGELSKQLQDVKVSDVKLVPADDGVFSKEPAYLELSFTTKYPQPWIDHDKKHYNLIW